MSLTGILSSWDTGQHKAWGGWHDLCNVWLLTWFKKKKKNLFFFIEMSNQHEQAALWRLTDAGICSRIFKGKLRRQLSQILKGIHLKGDPSCRLSVHTFILAIDIFALFTVQNNQTSSKWAPWSLDTVATHLSASSEVEQCMRLSVGPGCTIIGRFPRCTLAQG